MPSLRFFLFRSMMPFLRQSQARFRVQDIDVLVRFRERSERLANMLMPLPRKVTLENSNVGGVAGDWLIPRDAPDDPVIVFLHGGGIIFGWSNPNRRILAYIAKFSGLRAFGVDYRLPPDHCYPSAHDDCFTVYQTLVRQGKQIVLIGESSGGVLALAVLLRAKAEGLPQPPLCVLISPTVDYGFKDARIWNSDDVFAHPKFIVELHQHYIAGNDTGLPDLGPVYADLSGLAELYVLAAEHDILRIDVKKESFHSFIRDCERMQGILDESPEEVVDFIASLLRPNVDARLFEIVSFAILKAHYGDKFVFWGWELDKIEEEKLVLYKTGRTNANDGGIDFVMRPLGRFFQVTDTRREKIFLGY